MNRFLTAVAFLVLCGFVGILAVRVGRTDLTLVIVVSMLLAAYDLFVHRPGRSRR